MKDEIKKIEKKPFPWPILLAILLPLVIGGVLAVEWYAQDYILLARIGWVSLCSFIPGFSIMVILGSFAQIRKRWLLSTVSLLLGAANLGFCYWAVQQVTQHAADFLK